MKCTVCLHSIETIGEYAFAGTNASHIVIPDTVKTVGEQAFSQLKISESAQLPQFLTQKQITLETENSNVQLQLTGETGSVKQHNNIFYEAFTHNSNEEIRIVGYNVTKVKDKLHIPEIIDGKRVTAIGDNAMYRQTLTILKAPRMPIELPPSIRTIGDRAFMYTGPSDISTMPNLESVGDYAFNGSEVYNSKPFVLPRTLHTIGKEAFSYTHLTSVHVRKENTTIGASAFANNKKLKEVTFEEGVTTISDGAFSHNQLTSIHLPDMVIEIGNDAFFLNQLTSLKLPSNIKSIGIGAFSNNRLTEVTLPNSLEEVSYGLFSHNNIKHITLGENVKHVYVDSFGYNPIETIMVKGRDTVIEWDDNILTDDKGSPFSHLAISQVTGHKEQSRALLIKASLTATQMAHLSQVHQFSVSTSHGF